MSQEVQPGLDRTSELKHTLSLLPEKVFRSYNQLQENPASYLSDALIYANPQNRGEIEQLLKDFSPLRRAQVKEMLNTASRLGMPLAPVGVMSFVPGSLHKVKRYVDTMLNFGKEGQVRDSGGFALQPDELRTSHRDMGFWFVQSRTAYSASADPQLNEDFKQAQDFRLQARGINDSEAATIRGTYKYSTVNQRILKRLTGSMEFGRAAIRPDKDDVMELHIYAEHEALHAAMYLFNPSLVNYETFEGRVLSEFLAFRTDYLRDPGRIDEILQRFAKEYLSSFSNINPARLEIMKSLLTRIFSMKKDQNGRERALDQGYQANISAIAMTAQSATEFLETCKRVIDEGEVVPEIEELKKTIQLTVEEMSKLLVA